MSGTPLGPQTPRPPRKVTTRIEIPIRTIVTVVVAVAALWLLGRLWNQVLLIIVAVLAALALDLPVERLVRRGWPRGRAVGLLAVVFIAVIVFLLTLVVPPVVQQGERLAQNLPGYVDELQGLLEDYPTVQKWLLGKADQTAADPSAIFGGVLSVGTSVVSLVASLLIFLTLTVYLLLDGPRLFERLARGMPPPRRARAERVRRDVSHVVGGYARGQAIVSTLFATFTFIVLNLVGTPEPLLLAVMAAFFDAIPLVGATIATIPAVLLTLTVSVPAALVVLALYVVYQQVENYLIIPRVYRGTLQIPSLIVLIAVVIGSSLLGIIGALLSLPVAAAIPAVVRALHDEPPETPSPSPASEDGADV